MQKNTQQKHTHTCHMIIEEPLEVHLSIECTVPAKAEWSKRALTQLDSKAKKNIYPKYTGKLMRAKWRELYD